MAAAGKMTSSARKSRKDHEGRTILQPNIRHLEMFQLLCRTGSLTETARILRISQPAVSQALRELETQFGLELFLRGGGQVRPTEEALALQPEIERLIAQLGALTSRASELQNSRAGHIAISAIPVAAAHLLPGAIATFRRSRPRARVQLESLPTREVVERVKQEGVDLGVIVSPLDEAALTVEPVFETEFCCILPAGDALEARQTIGPTDLVGKSVIALNARTPPGLLLHEQLERHGAQQLIEIETNSATAALSLVRAGAGMAIIDPLPLLPDELSGLLVRRFSPAISLTVLALLSRHRAVPRITRQFLDSLRIGLRDSAAKLNTLGIPARAL